MEEIVSKIREMADKIRITEEKRKRLADFLRGIKLENRLAVEIEPEKMKGVKILAVDGGIVKRSLHGFDFILARAVGVNFHYSYGSMEKVDYFPSRNPTPQPFVLDALSELEWTYSLSITRQNLEIETAIQAAEKFKPDIVLLDGSIVPHYSDKPSGSSGIYKEYEKMIEKYKSLYRICDHEKILLAGVIEDSRGMSFCELLKDKFFSSQAGQKFFDFGEILEKTRDTNLLFWVLEPKERTMIFRYSEKPEDHPVLRDLGEWGKKIQSFYLKTARLDRPLRIDFMGSEEIGNRIASIILSVSGHHSGYGLPAPLIEADNVAKLSEDDIESFYDQISSFTGNIPSVMKLRREMRPF